MLDSHLILVGVLLISPVELVEETLFDRYVSSPLLVCVDCFSPNVEIDLSSQWSEVTVESLLASQRMVRIKHIKGLVELLVPPSQDKG